jgi:hypothetical protein
MAKSIRSALLANEVTNLAIFQAKGLIEETPKPIKTSTVKVDSKLKPKKHTDAELAQDTKYRNEFSEMMARPFGSVKGFTLGQAIEHSASVYTGLVKQKRKQLESLNEIGKVLQELRSVIGKSDKEFGQAVKATALKNMSRQDRSDAMWLSENWVTIQGKMKELDINSCSASYLRQLLRKEGKSAENYEVKAERNDVTEQDDSSEASSTVESSSLKLAEESAEGIASAVITIAKLKGISLAEIATLLLAESAT